MNSAVLKTLFHPFEAGLLPLPGPGARVLFLGAKPDLRLPEGWRAALSPVQGFRPDYAALQRQGYPVLPRPEGTAFDAAFVLAGRHRGENELRIAAALERTVPGGLVVVAGSKDDGIASLRKRLGGMVAIEGSEPKHHGIVFWLRSEGTDAAARALREANPEVLVDGRFATAPGMFSHDRIDPGSRLLAEALPQDLSGRVADFCAGWGYLSAELLRRCPKVRAVDLYEADFASLEAARSNLAEAGPVPVRFFWHDLVGEPVKERCDAIVMNPPFHQGRAAEPEVGLKLIATAARTLGSGGRLFLVANRQLPYEKALAASFPQWERIAGDGAFKVLSARR